MPTARSDADVILSHTDGSSNVVRLKLWRDSPNLPGGYASRVRPFLPERQPPGQANYQQVDPLAGLTWDMTTWHLGFGQGLETDFGRSARYGYSKGVLAISQGELVMGYLEDEVDLILRNGRFEWGATTGWTGTNVTVASSTDERTGTYALGCTVTSNNGTVSQSYGGTVSVLRSRVLRLVAYAKRLTGTGTCLVRLTDSAGSSDSSTVNSSEYTFLNVQRTIDSAATSVTFTFEFSTSGDTWVIDDVCVVPDGGVEYNSPGTEFAGSYYQPCGRMILKWSEGDTAFYPVYFDSAAEITGLISFSTDGTPRMYAGRGTSNNYLLSSDGTTWSNPATNSGNSRLGEFFARTRNANGDFAIAKNRGNKIALTTDPSDTANWGSEIQVGEDNHAVTNVFSADDTALVGKRGGLFVYDRDFNRFVDVEPGIGAFPDATNFDAAIGRGAAIFATGSDRMFWRIPFRERGQWAELSPLLRSSAFEGLGGRVTAITQDPSNIWVAIADDLASVNNSFPYSFPITFATTGISAQVFLGVLRSARGVGAGAVEDLIPHTVSRFTMSKVTQLGRFMDTGNALSSIFVFGGYLNSEISGTYSTEPRIVRLNLPVANENPALVGTRRVRLSGQFFTSWWDAGFPDARKATPRITATSRNLTSVKKITVYYKTDNADTDDDSGWTAFGTTGVINTSPVQTLTASLTSPIMFRRIRFRLDFETDSTSDEPPRLESFVVHAVLDSALDFLEWDMETLVFDQRRLSYTLRGARDDAVLDTVLSNVDTLRQQPFARLVDIDGVAYRVKIRDRKIVPLDTRIVYGGAGRPVRVYAIHLALSEAKTG